MKSQPVRTLPSIKCQPIKWIIGYIDSYGALHHHVVREGDAKDSHNHLWPGPKANKWRWRPSEPNQLNTYGINLDPEEEDKIWSLLLKKALTFQP